MPLLVFFQRIATVTHNAFQWARQPQKLPLSLGGFGSHLIQSYLGPPESVSQTASRLVQLFAGLTNVSNRHTERPTSSCKDVNFAEYSELLAVKANCVRMMIQSSFLFIGRQVTERLGHTLLITAAVPTCRYMCTTISVNVLIVHKERCNANYT